MSSKPYLLRWTAKVELSKKIQDPLGLYGLKFFEQHFLPGITTQTERLRYFSFLTWAWKKIMDEKLSWQKILDMEKILVLVAAYHHYNHSNYPKGIRNMGDAINFISKHEVIDVDEFRNFGRNNKIGYGNYYYKGPLAELRILWCEDDNIRLSSVGMKIANTLDNLSHKKNIFLRKRFSKLELSNLHPYCFCEEMITEDEKEIWRLVFFGFTKFTEDGDLLIDDVSYQNFNQGEIEPIPKLDIISDLQNGHFSQLSIEISQEAPNVDLQKLAKRNLWRRYTLFLILKIVEEAKPNVNNLNQTIRDAIYYKQIYIDDNCVKNINFGKLEKIREYWEVYIHNLYYISAFELIFKIFLDIIKQKPLGTTLDEVISSFNIMEVRDSIIKYGIIVENQDFDINEVDENIRYLFRGKKTSLESYLNERNLILEYANLKSYNERIANLLMLLLLLRYRYKSFNNEQKDALSYIEKMSDLSSLRPSHVYSSILNGKISDFIRNIFSLVKNRHKYVASKKYYYSNTRAWLFTEEDDVIYFYGRDYRVNIYREAKWRNVVELLIDMKLIKKKDSTFILSEVGKEWIGKIMST